MCADGDCPLAGTHGSHTRHTLELRIDAQVIGPPEQEVRHLDPEADTFRPQTAHDVGPQVVPQRRRGVRERAEHDLHMTAAKTKDARRPQMSQLLHVDLAFVL